MAFVFIISKIQTKYKSTHTHTLVCSYTSDYKDAPTLINKTDKRKYKLCKTST